MRAMPESDGTGSRRSATRCVTPCMPSAVWGPIKSSSVSPGYTTIPIWSGSGPGSDGASVICHLLSRHGDRPMLAKPRTSGEWLERHLSNCFSHKASRSSQRSWAGKKALTLRAEVIHAWRYHGVQYHSAMHLVGVLALHGVIPFDLAIPCEAVGYVVVPGVAEPYTVRVCGESREVKAGAYDLRVTWDLQQLAHAATIIVPGIRQPTMPISEDIVTALQTAARRGARIASICTGAFVLAAAGLLDGRRATTHWRAARELAELHPKVVVDPNVLFVDTGQILTSAGAAAGIDLCLHMIRCDYGAAAAAKAARLAGVPLRRGGGQAQYIAHEPAATSTTLEPVLRWMDTHLQHNLTLA